MKIFVLTLLTFCVLANSKQPVGFQLDGITQADIDQAKEMFYPMVIEELKHIELKDVADPDGGKIESLTINTKFPQAKDVVLKISNTSLYMEFPHFSCDTKGVYVDSTGIRSQVSFSVSDLSTFMRFNLATDNTADVDFDIDIKDIKLSVHSKFDQKAIDKTMSTGFSVLEKGLEQSTKRVLSQLFSGIPKRFLISDHLGFEFSPAP